MAGTPSKVAARNVVVSISDGLGTPTFYQIEGLTSLENSDSAVKTDATDFASGGRHEHWVMERTTTIKVAGMRQKATGQKQVEALADLVGSSSLRAFRIDWPLLPGESTAERWAFNASVVMTTGGGGN